MCLPALLFTLGMVCLIKGDFRLPIGRLIHAPVGRAMGVLMLIGVLFCAVSEVGVKVAEGILLFTIVFGLFASEKVAQVQVPRRAPGRTPRAGAFTSPQRIIVAGLVAADCLVFAIAGRLLVDRWAPSLPNLGVFQAPKIERATPLPTATAIDPQVLIRESFAQYRTALLAADGPSAAALVDRQTLDWYDEAWQQALTLPADELVRQPLYRQVVVIFFRHSLTRSQLAAAPAEGAYARAVEEGLVSLTGVETAEIAVVTVQGERASLSFQPEPASTALYLVLEDGRWKFALWKSFATLELVLKQVMAETGLSERELIVALIQSNSEFVVDERIFDGPRE